MTRTILAAIACIGAATPALATGGVYCDGPEGAGVRAYLTVGRVPGFAVVDAMIVAGDRAWSLSGRDGSERVEMAQGAIAGELLIADFADSNLQGITASLRVVRMDNDVGMAAAGVLSIPGIGAWPVTCEFE